GHAVALDGHDRPLAHRVQEVERERAAVGVELNLDLAGQALLFELPRLRIDLRRAHHDDAPPRDLGEEMRAEVVAPHVRGEDTRAAARLQRLEVLASLELPGGDHARLAETAGVAECPGEVPEDAVAAEEVPQRRRAG